MSRSLCTMFSNTWRCAPPLISGYDSLILALHSTPVLLPKFFTKLSFPPMNLDMSICRWIVDFHIECSQSVEVGSFGLRSGQYWGTPGLCCVSTTVLFVYSRLRVYVRLSGNEVRSWYDRWWPDVVAVVMKWIVSSDCRDWCTTGVCSWTSSCILIDAWSREICVGACVTRHWAV